MIYRRVVLALLLACLVVPARAQESLLDVVLKRDKIIVHLQHLAAARLCG
jgi:hypothetical protein